VGNNWLIEQKEDDKLKQEKLMLGQGKLLITLQ
jgi:hypothetical protein